MSEIISNNNNLIYIGAFCLFIIVILGNSIMTRIRKNRIDKQNNDDSNTEAMPDYRPLYKKARLQIILASLSMIILTLIAIKSVL